MADSRLYTIPGGVQAEAKKALAWRKEHKRGGTPVGLNTARTLAKGGQIGIQKIRHIAKYFPRHEVDKKGKGWGPGDDKFPSNGRIAWALWGGEPGKRWASAIVERENKKEATTAGGGAYGFVDNDYDSDIELDAFKTAHELDPDVGPEFMCRMRLDNSGIDRLYKIEIDGQVYLWDGSGWDNMGHVNGDVYSYDKSLDDPTDIAVKTHVIIDPSSAIIISAFLQERPFQPVKLNEIDPEETALMSDGLFSEDYSMIDRVMTAAGEQVPDAGGGLTDGDGIFTPEERSELAKQQPRDAAGLFVKLGSRTVVAGDTARGSGVLESIDYAAGKVNVRLDDGRLIAVDPKLTQKEEDVKPTNLPLPTDIPAVDMSGILGISKNTTDTKKAELPEGTAPMGGDALGALLTNFNKEVSEARTLVQNANAPVSKSDGLDQKAGDTPTKQNLDADGNYTVEKNDSLWSIAEKTKADGQSTEDQWLKILDANKGKLRSDDPNLIFPDEKVAIPGAKPNVQEAMRKDKQESSRAEAAKDKQRRDAQEGIRKGKQDESRAARPNAQEAMRQDKQGASKAEAQRAKDSANQDKRTAARNADRLETTKTTKAEARAEARSGMIADKKQISTAEAARKSTDSARDAMRDARNADRVDTTAKGKAAAEQKGKDAVRQDKQGASKAEAAKKSTDAARDALRDARNADRRDTTAKGKAAADQQGREAVRQDKRTASEAESSATKARAGQDAVRNARNADRLGTTAKAKQASDQQVRDASRQDKQAISKTEAQKANAQKGRTATQDAKKSEGPALSKTVADKGQARTQGDVSAAKKSDQPAIRESNVNKARERFREREQNLKQTRNKYGTYRERVDAAKKRLADNRPSEGGN